MRKLRRIGMATGILCLALFAFVGSVGADTVVYPGDWIAVGDSQVKATVTYLTTTELYYYEYEVQYASAASFYRFSVGNNYRLAYSAQGNDRPDKFDSPPSAGSSSISWGRKNGSGSLPGPVTVKFWYSSIYSYRTNVNTTVFFGGALVSSSAMTVGMNAPEPASAAALGMGVCGFAGVFIRRLRARR